MLERSTTVPHIVGVTSCGAAEGKTTLATNLARFIARDGSPVLLIDASCPDVASSLAQAETPGLQELLRGTAALDDAILRQYLPQPRFSCQAEKDLAIST